MQARKRLLLSSWETESRDCRPYREPFISCCMYIKWDSQQKQYKAGWEFYTLSLGFLAEIKLTLQSRNLFSVLGNKRSSAQGNQATQLAIFFFVFSESVFPKPQFSGSGPKLRVIISEVLKLWIRRQLILPGGLQKTECQKWHTASRSHTSLEYSPLNSNASPFRFTDGQWNNTMGRCCWSPASWKKKWLNKE